MKQNENDNNPQCLYFVKRKKRLCRMTVRPGKQYCGEHEPNPESKDKTSDSRIPCPLDPKHTCYISKLDKHLKICNAKQTEQPEYIVHNINAGGDENVPIRRLLVEVPLEELMKVVVKVNRLYDEFLKDEIKNIPEGDIHPAVLENFNEPTRTESSKRHLRQSSALMRIIENESLVRNHTGYVELGAGKGQLSCFAWRAWCGVGSGSVMLLVDRAALRHKKDSQLRHNALSTNTSTGTTSIPSDLGSKDSTNPTQDPADSLLRVRADLAHLNLSKTPALMQCQNVVGFAKHLCGVATDYALRCISQVGPNGTTSGGVVLATCCHHRCQLSGYVGRGEMQKLGVTDEDFNIILSIVSWATCGDGRSRERRKIEEDLKQDKNEVNQKTNNELKPNVPLSQKEKEEVGRRAKALVDLGRILYLRSQGFDARLSKFVDTSVSLENLCIVAKRN